MYGVATSGFRGEGKKRKKRKMNAIEDKHLSRETRKGLYMFFAAERLRHEQDIEAIERFQEQLIDELGLTLGELLSLDEKAKKYVEF